ncbi:60 kDa SS-A/Ro ribonucleoprotein [Solenopsis invicta]|uniref:60 kDa SS-A/Ro ribonucleoprotein n=1 Tax=Solenopsis invicta TaxID=13686 RepID=UPI00059632EF|nr:60 kDa SS-A/Ro ribonucleoprotein [Solenopsis invicta]XP_039308843.1 60 kDa SS-A/Ro ribonucleoprotein [Solenopsis invicta]
MATEGNSNDPELRLLRYLYVGKEYPNYQPGCWFAHHYFIVSNVLSIEELAENEEKELVPVELIRKAFDSKLVTHPETLVFALAVCCRQDKSKKLRQLAYQNVSKICAFTPNFILFVKFVSKLCREKELNFITQGWGHGMRRTINSWYLSKQPLEFIECVTKYKSRYGWKHKDIVKMSHPQGSTPAHRIILKYMVHGMAKIKDAADQENDSSVTQLIEYIQQVEDFKRCEDEVRAAGLLEKYGFSLDHVPGHLLKSKEVWHSLILKMDVAVLLNNLQRIHNLGFLTTDEPTVDRVIERLTDQYHIQNSAVHPALVFITLKNYQCSGKSLSYEKRKIREQAKKSMSPGFDPNIKIMEALNEAFLLSFNNIQSTNLRYLVTINTNKLMDAPTWQNGNMTGFETAALIALILLRSEENVTIATFNPLGDHFINVLDIQTESLENILRTLKTTPGESVILNRPIVWALKQSEKYDIFINIVDQIYEKHDDSQEVLISYKEQMNLPQTKLINCTLCSSSSFLKNYDRHVLTINGFDATVPNVIKAFAKGLF